MVYKSGRVSLNPLTLHSCIQLFMYSFILLFSSSPPPDPARPAALQNPRPIRRDLPRCKAPARPAGTSLNLTLLSLTCTAFPPAGGLRGALNLTLHSCIQLFMYSCIHVFYYSHPLPRPIRRDLPRCKAPARPAGTSLNLTLLSLTCTAFPPCGGTEGGSHPPSITIPLLLVCP